MMRLIRWVVLFAVWMSAAQAQVASLLADQVTVGDGSIRATGNVEVIYETTRLTASTIIYDQREGVLIIEGPIVLTERDGQSILMADQAQLDSDLQNGILRSARLVLERELQLAASEIARVDGRYTQLSRTVASSCRVCASNPVPLWQIRASSVIHDQQMQRLFFENAVLDFMGLPIFYIPRLSVPDPSQTRATGFLVPSQRSSTLLGNAVEIPYFVTLGPSRDLTFTPLLSSQTRTLNLRYRQAFAAGRAEVNGALTSDELLPGSARGYVFAEGQFRLANDATLKFDLKYASDPTYLAAYGISQSRLQESSVSVDRTDEVSDTLGRIEWLQILSGPELAYSTEIPRFTGRAEHRRYVDIPGLAGTVIWSLSADAAFRESGTDQIGRDSLRLGTALTWNASRTLPNGMIASMGADASLDAHFLAGDSSYQAANARAFTGVDAALRWPMIRADDHDGIQTIEPVVHLAWSQSVGDTIPNEDSRTTILDEANLFDITRFAGEDRAETGARLATGLTWTRRTAAGNAARLAGGVVFSDRVDPDHTVSSGLLGSTSDLLLAGQLDLDDRLELDGQVLWDWNGTLTLADLRMNWDNDRTFLSARHSWAVADPALNRPEPVAEFILDGRYRINGNWALTGAWQYDYNLEEPVSNRLGLEFRNECIKVDLSASRRFQSSANIVADTDFGLKVELIGFGSGDAGPARTCVEGGW